MKRSRLVSVLCLLVSLVLVFYQNPAQAGWEGKKVTKTSPPSTPETFREISAKALSDHDCDSSEWHFVITQIEPESNAPSQIHVTWANGASENVGINKYTGKTAHYTTTSNLDSAVTGATAMIYNSWHGEFNLSHGPCGESTKTATPTATEVIETQTPTSTETVETDTPTPTEVIETDTPTATEVIETQTPTSTETVETDTPTVTNTPGTATPTVTKIVETATPTVTKTPPKETPTTVTPTKVTITPPNKTAEPTATPKPPETGAGGFMDISWRYPAAGVLLALSILFWLKKD